VIRAALFSPPPFSPSKLAVSYLPGVTPHGPLPLASSGGSESGSGNNGNESGGGASSSGGASSQTRTYTLTHNDLTGALLLSIGPRVNAEQVRGLYTRLVRDEVVAEWRFDYAPPQGLVETAEQRRRRERRDDARQRRRREREDASSSSSSSSPETPPPSLHVYCHVSGEERWLAPPQLRAFVFRREMALVLAALRSGDRALLASSPELRQAPVYVHFQSHVEHLDTVEAWGTLGDPSSWPGVAFGGAGGGAMSSDGSSSSSDWAEPLRRWAEGRPLLLALLGATATASDQSDSSGEWEEEDDRDGLGLEEQQESSSSPATAAAAAAAAGSARRRALVPPPPAAAAVVPVRVTTMTAARAGSVAAGQGGGAAGSVASGPASASAAAAASASSSRGAAARR
jgi:hypothetical protein